MEKEYEDIIEDCISRLESVRIYGKRPSLSKFYAAVKELENRARDRYRMGVDLGEITN